MDVALGRLLAAKAWRTARWTAQKKRWIWPWGSLLPALDAHKKPSMGGFRGVEGLERLEPIDAFAEL